MTILLTILVIVFSFIIMFNIFTRKHYNLDSTARPVVTLNTDKDLKLLDQIRPCPSVNGCELVTVEEIVPLLNFIQYLVVFTNSTDVPPIDCSSLSA